MKRLREGNQRLGAGGGIVLIAITIVKGLLCAWFFTCLVLFNPTKMMKVGLKILFLFSETQERK